MKRLQSKQKSPMWTTWKTNLKWITRKKNEHVILRINITYEIYVFYKRSYEEHGNNDRYNRELRILSINSEFKEFMDSYC